jgi:hypothetical protein
VSEGSTHTSIRLTCLCLSLLSLFAERRIGSSRMQMTWTSWSLNNKCDTLLSSLDSLITLLSQITARAQAEVEIEAPRSGRYHLMGIICHLGRNTDHGHYACHLKKDEQWVFFNDDKVRLLSPLCLSLSSPLPSASSLLLGWRLRVTSLGSWVHVSLQE